MAAYKMFCVVALMSCFMFTAAEKIGKCDRCTFVRNCPQAVSVLRERGTEPAVQWLFQDVLSCQQNHARRISKMKICCSKLEQYNVIDLENHRNARLLPENCGQAYGYRIFGGTVADLEEFPWMVIIAYNGETFGVSTDQFRTRAWESVLLNAKRNNIDNVEDNVVVIVSVFLQGSIEFKCGGSLITARYVLTASHCVSGQKIAYVRVGDYDLNNSTDCQEYGYCVSNTQNIPIQQMILYPKYKKRYGSDVPQDIALLRLNATVNFASNIGTVCLPITRELQKMDLWDTEATVTGWGDSGTGQKSDVLLKAEVPVYSRITCSQYYGIFKRETSSYSVICAGQEGVDTCQGDSGGPLTVQFFYKDNYRHIQFGITSFGHWICGTKKPAVYTDVRFYMNWILDTIKP